MENQKQQAHIPGETLHRLLHGYKRSLIDAMHDANMPMPVSHIRVLKWLARVPAITPLHLSEKSGQDKGRIARLIKELEKEGLIERQPHPEDRRSQTLHLTPAGENRLNDFRALETHVRSRMTRGLTRGQIHDFVEIANLIADNLESPK
ncbi:MarR family winged helix-turn-helix transcriptional regulator [Thalassospira sp. MA62]|nr:MarR family winged helix-turn-helix transcriptional regulator [Thalassospira sp. MA62]